MNGFLQLLLILAVSEVSKSTLRFNDSLEGLIELKKGVVLMVTVYCSNGIQKGKWCTRRSPGEIRHELQVIFCPCSHMDSAYFSHVTT